MTNLISLLVSLTAVSLLVLPSSSALQFKSKFADDQVKRWKDQSNILQSDSIAQLSNKFMKNLQYDSSGSGDPRAQTVFTFDDCGKSGDAVTIESFEVEPNPPEPGQKVIVRASGTVHQLIEDGAFADVVVKLGSYIKLLQKRFDICEELSKANATLQCPIEPGHYEIVQEVTLPKEIPHAKYKVEARAFTQDDDDMACTDIVLDFMKS